MLFVHEIHEVLGGRMDAFGEAVRTVWQPLVEERGDARLLWYWELAHGTSASYQAVTLTAVRDWAAWGTLVERMGSDPRFAAWSKLSWTLRRETTAKIMLPTSWSPLREVDLSARAAAPAAEPAIYLHDTGWPYPGKFDEYVDALGAIYLPQTRAQQAADVRRLLRDRAGHGPPSRGRPAAAPRRLAALRRAPPPRRAGRAALGLDGGRPPLPRPLGIAAAPLRRLVAETVVAAVGCARPPARRRQGARPTPPMAP